MQMTQIQEFQTLKKTNFPKLTSHLIHVLTPIETIKIFYLTFGSEKIHNKTWANELNRIVMVLDDILSPKPIRLLHLT